MKEPRHFRVTFRHASSLHLMRSTRWKFSEEIWQSLALHTSYAATLPISINIFINFQFRSSIGFWEMSRLALFSRFTRRISYANVSFRSPHWQKMNWKFFTANSHDFGPIFYENLVSLIKNSAMQTAGLKNKSQPIPTTSNTSNST